MEKGNVNHDGAGIGFSTTGSWITIKPEPQGIVKRTLPSITTFTAFRLYDSLRPEQLGLQCVVQNHPIKLINIGASVNSNQIHFANNVCY